MPSKRQLSNAFALLRGSHACQRPFQDPSRVVNADTRPIDASRASSAGSSDSVDTARGPGVACLVAEAVTSEALCAAPGDTSFLCGSTYSTSQIDGGLPATFAGDLHLAIGYCIYFVLTAFSSQDSFVLLHAALSSNA